jgi:hypothetical protein
MRAQVDGRKMSARATLTVRRLGEKAVLLLDGKPAGSEGEMENETIPIGSHTLTVVDRRNNAFSRALELYEGQKTTLVYDAPTQQLRPMAEADSEALARRRSNEAVHRVPVEHSHGLLRGSCKGILLVSSREVVFEPAAGAHGFRVPFDQVNLRVSGRILEISQISDGKDLQSYRALDPQEAEIFKQAWDQLKSMARQ